MKDGGGSDTALYHWFVYYSITDLWRTNHSFSFPITMDHRDASHRLAALRVDCMMSQGPQQDHGYRNTVGWTSWAVPRY
jgi:hypothetical protein